MTAGVVSNTGDLGGGLSSSAISTMISTAVSTVDVSGQYANFNVGAITAPANTALKMGGAGSTVTFTPTRSGNVLVIMNGTVGPSVGSLGAGDGLEAELYYGTGSAPANNAAVTGTQFGTANYYENGTALTGSDGLYPFVLAAVAHGLTIGTPYWFDIAQAYIAVTGLELQSVSFTLVEL